MPKSLAKWTGAKEMRLVWEEPPSQDWQFLAMGNGRIGITAFLPDELVVQVDATDNWNEDGDLPGICRWRIDVGGKPFQPLEPFTAWMDLRQGQLVFQVGDKEGVKIVLRVQKDADVVVADIYDFRSQPQPITVWLETWRQGWKVIFGRDAFQVLVERNEKSRFKELCSAQLMAEWAERNPDPWLHWGTAVAMATSKILDEKNRWIFPPARHTRLILAVFIGRGTTDDLAAKALKLLREVHRKGDADLDAVHKQSWQRFWEHTFLHIELLTP